MVYLQTRIKVIHVPSKTTSYQEGSIQGSGEHLHSRGKDALYWFHRSPALAAHPAAHVSYTTNLLLCPHQVTEVGHSLVPMERQQCRALRWARSAPHRSRSELHVFEKVLLKMFKYLLFLVFVAYNAHLENGKSHSFPLFRAGIPPGWRIQGAGLPTAASALFLVLLLVVRGMRWQQHSGAEHTFSQAVCPSPLPECQPALLPAVNLWTSILACKEWLPEAHLTDRQTAEKLVGGTGIWNKVSQAQSLYTLLHLHCISPAIMSQVTILLLLWQLQKENRFLSHMTP